LLDPILTAFVCGSRVKRASYENASFTMLSDACAVDELSQHNIWSTEYSRERLPVSEVLVQIAYGCEILKEPRPKL